MKYLLLSFALFTGYLFGQTTFLKIKKSNGIIDAYPIENIDKITFPSEMQLKIDQNDNLFSEYSISEISKIFFNQNSVLNTNTIEQEKAKLKNFPNPFSSFTTIEFSHSKAGNTEVSIYDINGKLIKQVFKKYLEAGSYSFLWDGKSNSGNIVPGGIYICSVINEYQTSYTKLVFVK